MLGSYGRLSPPSPPLFPELTVVPSSRLIAWPARTLIWLPVLLGGLTGVSAEASCGGHVGEPARGFDEFVVLADDAGHPTAPAGVCKGPDCPRRPVAPSIVVTSSHDAADAPRGTNQADQPAGRRRPADSLSFYVGPHLRGPERPPRP
jgi:hypothetical protein